MSESCLLCNIYYQLSVNDRNLSWYLPCMILRPSLSLNLSMVSTVASTTDLFLSNPESD